MKKLIAMLLLAVMMLSLSTSLAEDKDYTFEEMVAWAIQDEIDAEAAYQAILAAFGSDLRPFANIKKAEINHQALLQPLMEQYGIPTPVPAPVTAPATLVEAMQLGIEAEEKNIDMYERFLDEDDLPEQVKAVFERLKSASENHLAAFSRRAARLRDGRNAASAGTENPGQNASGRNGRRTTDSTADYGNRRNQRNRKNSLPQQCPNCPCVNNP